MDDLDTTFMGHYLTFRLGDESFAVNVMQVTELLEMLPITKVPKAPPAMKGVINLRGTVVPVVDTRIKFSLTEKAHDINTCIIVLNIESEEADTMIIGAIVDSVNEVIEVKDKDIKKLPSIGLKKHTQFITGVIQQEDEFVMVLDVVKVFSTEELIQLHSAEELMTTND